MYHIERRLPGCQQWRRVLNRNMGTLALALVAMAHMSQVYRNCTFRIIGPAGEVAG